MEKINFQDLPNTDTPINSKNLNQLQTNVENEINNLEKIITTKDILFAMPSQQEINGASAVIIFTKQSSSIGSKLSIENGAIKIGAGVNLIKVDAKIGGQVGGTDLAAGFEIALRKNETKIMGAQSSLNASAYNILECNLPSIILSVQEGDLIDLIAYSLHKFVINSSYTAKSYITVEVIE